MATFTPAVTLLNALEVVRLNRSISIFLVISNLFTHSRLDQSCVNSVSPALLNSFPTALFSSAKMPS